MDGFEKIELNGPIAQSSNSTDMVSSAPAPFPAKKRRFNFSFLKRKSLLIPVAVIIVFIVALIFPAMSIVKSANVTAQQAQGTLAALKTQNISLASTNLDQTEQALTQTQKELHGISFLKWVPVFAWYYNDADHMINAGFAGIGATRVVLESVAPYADVLGLKGQGSFAGGTAENRIQTAVSTMSKVTPRIDDVEKYLITAQKEIDQVNPAHYPPIFGLKKVHEGLSGLRTGIDGTTEFVSQAKPLIKVLPDLLGAKTSKKYLVIFQNDKELRPTGGFITAYSIFSLDKGVIHVDKSDNIYNLDNTISGKPKAPEMLQKYLKVGTLNLRDSNTSPDFIKSMEIFNSLYNKAGASVDVDGIIAVDTNVLVSTIKILDDSVSAAGQTFTTKTDPRCDCPQVIYALEDNISTPLSLDLRVSDLAAIQAGRKSIIGDLMYAIMEKALKSSPKVYWGPLMQDFIAQVNQKHILFNLYDAGAQQGIHAVNADGKILTEEGDYLHINEANLGGAKSNIFVSKDVKQEYETSGDEITKTVTVAWQNPFPASDCNLERGNLCLNATLQDWVRIYVPKGAVLVDSKGSEIKMKTYEDLGKTVFEGFVLIRPKGTATLKVSYKLPSSVKFDPTLPLLIQKQPGTYEEDYEIRVNGSKKQEFTLLSDKKLQLSK